MDSQALEIISSGIELSSFMLCYLIVAELCGFLGYPKEVALTTDLNNQNLLT